MPKGLPFSCEKVQDRNVGKLPWYRIGTLSIAVIQDRNVGVCRTMPCHDLRFMVFMVCLTTNFMAVFFASGRPQYRLDRPYGKLFAYLVECNLLLTACPIHSTGPVLLCGTLNHAEHAALMRSTYARTVSSWITLAKAEARESGTKASSSDRHRAPVGAPHREKDATTTTRERRERRRIRQ